MAVMQVPLLQIDIHTAIILWNGLEREVRVAADGYRPLLGIALLDEQELRVRVHGGDLVSVQGL